MLFVNYISKLVKKCNLEKMWSENIQAINGIKTTDIQHEEPIH